MLISLCFSVKCTLDASRGELFQCCKWPILFHLTSSIIFYSSHDLLMLCMLLLALREVCFSPVVFATRELSYPPAWVCWKAALFCKCSRCCCLCVCRLSSPLDQPRSQLLYLAGFGFCHLQSRALPWTDCSNICNTLMNTQRWFQTLQCEQLLCPQPA